MGLKYRWILKLLLLTSINCGKVGAASGLRLITAIRNLIIQHDNISISHIYREANHCVDVLAHQACRMVEDLSRGQPLLGYCFLLIVWEFATPRIICVVSFFGLGLA